MIRAPIPLTVIGGFLGAGKTTLLNRLLSAATGRRFVVMVNDFGALDIDSRLVVAHGGDTIALANGCLCCTIGDSLVTTLLALLEKPDRFDHIVVEASGVADPGRIADLAVLDPRLSRDGVIVVVDAETVRQRVADRRVGDTVMRQIVAADLLLLNKVDLAEGLFRLRDWLAARSRAPILVSAYADVPIDLLFGLDRRGAAAAHDTAAAFSSWSYEWPEPVERAVVLDLLRTTGVLRAKGIVRLADAPARRSVVHQVGARLDIDDSEAWRDGETSRLVLLGLKPSFPPRHGSREGDVSPPYGDLPSPRRSRFGFTQAGGGAKDIGTVAHDPSARFAGTSPRFAQGGRSLQKE